MKKFFNIAFLLLIAVAIGLWIALIWPWWVALNLIVLRVLFLLLVSAVPKWNYFIKGIHKIETDNPQVAITFDDGPTPITAEVLDILKQHQAKATFFCIGKQIEKHPEIFRRLVSEGHDLGNHTYSHSYFFGFFSKKRLLRDIEMCDLIAKETADVKMQYLRPPFGITNPMLRKALYETKHKPVFWSKRSFDTILNDDEKIIARLTSNIKQGDILLLHDSLEKTPGVLEGVLKVLEEKKLKSVGITDLMNSTPDVNSSARLK